LSGKRILLIFVQEENPEVIHVLAGDARWTGDELLVQSNGLPPVVVDALDVSRSAFEVRVLPDLLAPTASRELLEIASDVEYCVPVATAAIPPSAAALPMPFCAIVLRDKKTVLLMGLPSEAEEEESIDSQWVPDEEDRMPGIEEGGYDDDDEESNPGFSVAFSIRANSDRHLFDLELESQRFPIYESGFYNGTKGWIRLVSDASAATQTRLLDWLRARTDVSDLTYPGG
jgi:hypothetical protein